MCKGFGGRKFPTNNHFTSPESPFFEPTSPKFYIFCCKRTGQYRKGELALKPLNSKVLYNNLGFQKSPVCPIFINFYPFSRKSFIGGGGLFGD